MEEEYTGRPLRKKVTEMSKQSPGTKADQFLYSNIMEINSGKEIFPSSVLEPPPIESSEVRQKPLKIIFQLLNLSLILENIKTLNA